MYYCFVFLPDWVLNVAVCRGADAGVKMSGEVKKSNDVSAASDNSHLFEVGVRLFSERVFAGQLELNGIGSAPLMPAFALLSDCPLLLSMGTGSKPVQEATLAKTTFLFF